MQLDASFFSAATHSSARALTFTICPTFDEFFQQHELLGPRIRQRMREVRISADEQEFFCAYPDFLHFVALIHEETPDSWIVLPIWARMANTSARFDLRVLNDEANLTLLSRLLDDGDAAAFLEEHDLPLLLIFDEEWRLQAQWGPHPQAAESYLEEWLAEHPQYEALADSDAPADHDAYLAMNEQLAGHMRIWYNGELTRATLRELRELLAGLHSEDDDDDGESGE